MFGYARLLERSYLGAERILHGQLALKVNRSAGSFFAMCAVAPPGAWGYTDLPFERGTECGLGAVANSLHHMEHGAPNAIDNDLTLNAAALKLSFVTEEKFSRVVDPAKMVKSYVARA